jgi:hypothetical protein
VQSINQDTPECNTTSTVKGNGPEIDNGGVTVRKDSTSTDQSKKTDKDNGRIQQQNKVTNNGDASDEVNACIRDTNSAAGTCDTSKANNFSSKVSQQNTGGYGQMNGAQQVNIIVANCSDSISTCSSTCDNSLQSAKSKCGDDCSSTLNSQISQINATTSRCNGLNSNLSTLQNAGNQALNNAQQQQQQQNGMNPSSTGNGNNNNQPQAVASASGSVDCTNPVNASQCSVQKSESAAKDTPGNDTGMQEASGNTGNKSNGFNVGDPGTEKQNAQFAENQQQRGNQSGAGMSPMGGGSSSGFNFGAGNNNQQAGGPAPNRMAMNANKTAADVLHGEGSRSGYSSPVSRSIASISGRGGGVGSASFGSFGGGGSDMKDMRGLDLKQYLPGGSKDGTRRISGANFAHPDINNQNSNMWVNISNRFQVHCKLQLLYDCH